MKPVEEMTIQEIVENIGPLVVNMTPQQWEDTIVRVWLEGTEEDAKRFLQNNYDYTKAICEACEDHSMDIIGGASSDEVLDATNRAAARIAAAWKKVDEVKKVKNAKIQPDRITMEVCHGN